MRPPEQIGFSLVGVVALALGMTAAVSGCAGARAGAISALGPARPTAAATQPASADSQAAGAPLPGFTIVPLGLCEDYPEESRSLAEVRRDFATLRQAGVALLRVSIGWDGLEPERDRYDWAFWDAFFAESHQAGVRIIPYVAYTPRWASRSKGPDYWKSPPLDVRDFEEVMRLLAARYRDRVTSWEIWNEPDNRDYWIGSSGEFAALLAAGAHAVRSANPSAKVVLGGIAGHPEFAVEILGRSDVAPLVDVVNAHAYYETWNGQPTETLPAYVRAFRPALHVHSGAPAKARALWLAEVGYSTYRRGAIVSPDYRARFAYEHTDAFQAVALVRTTVLALSLSEVALFAWYEVKDPAPGAPMIGDDNNRHLGVTFADGRPKPALSALAFMSRLFGRGFVRLGDRVRVERQPRSAAEVHAFLTADRHVVVVAWLPTVTPDTSAAANSAPAGNEADVRLERISLELPFVPVGAVQFLDAQGRGRPSALGGSPAGRATSLRLDAVEVRGGDVTVLDIPVEAPPVALIH